VGRAFIERKSGCMEQLFSGGIIGWEKTDEERVDRLQLVGLPRIFSPSPRVRLEESRKHRVDRLQLVGLPRMLCFSFFLPGSSRKLTGR